MQLRGALALVCGHVCKRGTRAHNPMGILKRWSVAILAWSVRPFSHEETLRL